MQPLAIHAKTLMWPRVLSRYSAGGASDNRQFGSAITAVSRNGHCQRSARTSTGPQEISMNDFPQNLTVISHEGRLAEMNREFGPSPSLA